MADLQLGEDGDDLDYWRLCDELNVYEAALLVAGHSPQVSICGEFGHREATKGL